MVLAGSFAHAEDTSDGASKMERLMAAPAGMAMGSEEDNFIRITPDKTKILRLDEDAASVIVTNPVHASVLLDSPRLLIVMPRVPGSTSFTVLNADGAVITEKTVIVSAMAEQKYVRIRRMCDTGGGAGCVPTAYFYCPDGCYEVLAVPGGGGQQSEVRARRALSTTTSSPPPPPGSIAPPPAPAPAPAPSTTQQAPAK